MAYQIPLAARPIVEKLAQVVLPIAPWVQGPKPAPRFQEFIPPLQDVPWRPAGGPPTLTTADINFAVYLEQQADRDAQNEALAPRWRQLKADPTRFFQNRSGQTAAAWRAGRANVNPETRFGPFDGTSNNFAFFTLDDGGKPKDALTRKEFYDACWAPLGDSFQAAQPNDPPGWSAFLNGLIADSHATWPITKLIRSSSFVRRFSIDLLVASLSQKNPAIAGNDPLLQRAVLIEASENRQPATRFAVSDADQAVDHFMHTI